MFENFYVIAGLAFLTVLLALYPLRKYAPAIGLIDKPDADQGGRKDHEGHIPLVGGLAIFGVFILFSSLTGHGWGAYWPLYTALLLLLVTGAVDDRVHLSSWTKFGLQFVAAALVVLPGGAELNSLGNLFGLGAFGLNFMSIPFSIVSVVLLINAINLMDGLDGLAGGVTFVILGWFLAGCLWFGEALFHPSILILMGALAGFLVHNMRSPFRKKASVFLGDAGSTCLGLMIGWYAIHLSPLEARVLEPMAVAWVLALPIWDECAQFNRRVREGRHPFSADRGHFHYHFIEAGFGVGQSVFMILIFVCITGAIGVLGVRFGVPLPVLTIFWIVAILGHIATSRKIENYPNLIKSLKRLS